MKGSLRRVRQVMALEKPDRAPLFDLLPNDAVLSHFNSGAPVAVGDDRTGAAAVAEALDGTRPSQFSPGPERIEHLEDGREVRSLRWTVWEQKRVYASSEEYRRVKRQSLADRADLVSQPYDTPNSEGYLRHLQVRSWLGEDFYYVMGTPHQSLMGVWAEVGLEPFSYYLYDCEEVVVEQLEWNAAYACRWIEGLPESCPFECAFIGDDIAFKTGPMVQVKWLERHYFPRLERVCAALHAKGIKAMFHSDGNLNAIMDGLVEAGIDALNPIEVCAGMDLADLHRRYPKLVFAGGIDVSHLLPFGTPQQVRDAVVRAIDDTEGRILIGSSTEVFDMVPLQNFLAMRETAMNYRS